MMEADRIVVIDECVDNIDAVTTRVIVCCAQLNRSQADEIKNELLSIKNSTKHGKKFHMSDIKDYGDREHIMERISKLPFNATILLYYECTRNQQRAKITALRKIVREEEQLLAGQKAFYIVECSDEYKNIVKKQNLEDGKDNILTFLPDAVCYAYRLVLTGKSGSDLYGKYIRFKIRLEIRIMDGGITRLSRQNKL